MIYVSGAGVGMERSWERGKGKCRRGDGVEEWS